ncbi:50S ribosomal protein L20 [Candidatus Kaiserbacteria bacterium]|nr:50S ribosomal protein L20 [Candidatus Kaiserbacteria bacterium]
MSRVKRGTTKLKRRRNILAQTKGYRFGRSTKERTAKEAISHAGRNAFRDRKTKKRLARNVWTIRINAAVRPAGLSYSRFIDTLKKADIALDRKALAALAKDHPEAFTRLIETIK